MNKGNGKRRAKPLGRRKKTPEKSSAAVQLVPQPHGGALQVGNPGNPGGGRPPSIIREQLRGSFAQRVTILEDIADGLPMQYTEVALADLLPHVTCPTCGGALSARAGGEPEKLAIIVRVSAVPRDRVRALDVLAKYGLGTMKELTVDHIRGLLERQYQILLDELDPQTFQRVDVRLGELWQ